MEAQRILGFPIETLQLDGDETASTDVAPSTAQGRDAALMTPAVKVARTTFKVTVPPNVMGGDLLTVKLTVKAKHGHLQQVTVPLGLKAGDMFDMPDSSPSPAAATTSPLAPRWTPAKASGDGDALAAAALTKDEGKWSDCLTPSGEDGPATASRCDTAATPAKASAASNTSASSLKSVVATLPPAANAHETAAAAAMKVNPRPCSCFLVKPRVEFTCDSCGRDRFPGDRIRQQAQELSPRGKRQLCKDIKVGCDTAAASCSAGTPTLRGPLGVKPDEPAPSDVSASEEPTPPSFRDQQQQAEGGKITLNVPSHGLMEEVAGTSSCVGKNERAVLGEVRRGSVPRTPLLCTTVCVNCKKLSSSVRQCRMTRKHTAPDWNHGVAGKSGHTPQQLYPKQLPTGGEAPPQFLQLHPRPQTRLTRKRRVADLTTNDNAAKRRRSDQQSSAPMEEQEEQLRTGGGFVTTTPWPRVGQEGALFTANAAAVRAERARMGAWMSLI